ncbi:hypothetical protein SteCoe_14374 [Stentor coeruleus]|uniref:Uncharacterized protein n=1 Tax=Stentor coeruleus TaxID=5963 RepID=A0A1R2C3W2_9CILI|nr:hypothetical protein SteCoe_15322 [Stentor coeruleus]OMJ84489.1 hypothetical protein SteCoe_14374 [Stentor coeruleus]
MGNCIQCKKLSIKNAKEHPIFKAIINGSRRDLEQLIKYMAPSQIDSLTTKFDDYNTNPLGYTIILNKGSMFKLLHKKGCSLESMEKIFNEIGLKSVDAACILASLDLFKYFFPLYLHMQEQMNISAISLQTINFEKSNLAIKESYPIHRACRNGNLEVVKFLYNYYLNSSVPIEYDVHIKDEIRGENCALLACRKGDIDMVKFLHKTCKANFKILNSNKENALLICVSGMKTEKKGQHFKVIRYLIEKVKIDLQYNCEEIMLIAMEPEVIEYLEYQFAKIGCGISKEQAEYHFSKLCRNRSSSEAEYLKKNLKVDTKVIITQSFLNELKEAKDTSQMSPIKNDWSIGDAVKISVISEISFK